MKTAAITDRILIVSRQKADLNLFKKSLGAGGPMVEWHDGNGDIAKISDQNDYAAVCVDCDFAGRNIFKLLEHLQQTESRTCTVLYGLNSKPEHIAEMLQAGAYAYVSRPHLSERIRETIIGGIENRNAFVEILTMMSDLREMNLRLEKEKSGLEKKNQELHFINRLSNEVAYDLNWDRILPRVLNAGLKKVIPAAVVGILYAVDAQWRLALDLSGKSINKEFLKKLKTDIIHDFIKLSDKKISVKKTSLHLLSKKVKLASTPMANACKPWLFPLSLAGKSMGMLVVVPTKNRRPDADSEELLSTVSNLLAMSLRNAQEYRRLKETAVRDGLTGAYNYKGFQDFIQKEFQRAKRYRRPLSLIMIDVDRFKDINDTFGHPAGDHILKEVAACFQTGLRKPDIVARYGGDEFAVLLPDTDIEEAQLLMQRVAAPLKQRPFYWKNRPIEITFSYGISTSFELNDHQDEKELISIADARLYAAKRRRSFRPPLAQKG